AEGYAPQLSQKLVDPGAAPPTFTLARHNLDGRPAALVLTGRVLDEQGRPVPEATVEPRAFRKGNVGRGGYLEGLDLLALTNDKGEFRLCVPEEGMLISVDVAARFKAPRKFHRLPTGDKPNDLVLFTGVTLTGRVVKDGKPLRGVAVGTAQKDH